MKISEIYYKPRKLVSDQQTHALYRTQQDSTHSQAWLVEIQEKCDACFSVTFQKLSSYLQLKYLEAEFHAAGSLRSH
jgi:hypothetical protein